MNKNNSIGILPSVFAFRKHKAKFFLPLLSMTLALSSFGVQAQERSGKEVVDAVCAKCHATGLNGAPKIGDKQAWSGRATLGLSSLTVHALQGIRNMPAHGGDPKLSDLEIARAITYMVNQSGGNWVAPESAQDLTKERTGEEVVKETCVKCHAEGVGGAPKIGDLHAWVQRLKHGLPYLVHSAIRGHGGMPPRGGQANLTDSEIRSAILYMYNPAGMPKTPKASEEKATGANEENHQSSNGTEIYLGIVSAETIRALPKSSPERRMHGGVPMGSGYYHVNISLFDSKTNAPINHAQIKMQLEHRGVVASTVNMESMLGGEGSYGTYAKPPPGGPYQLTFHIKRPGVKKTITVKFERDFE